MKRRRIGEYLRRLRTRSHGLAELARLIGVSHTALSLIERDKRPPSTIVLKGYAKHLDIDYDTLCCEAGQIPDDLTALILASPQALRRARQLFAASNEGDDDDVPNAFDQNEEDERLIEELIDTGDQLRETQREDMEDMLDRLRSGNMIKLSDKQRKYVLDLRRKAGLDDKGENIFSSLPPEEQARQRAAAAHIKLPWERD